MMIAASSFSIDPREFAGKRALVTGGTKGMGEAIVRRPVASGATVATTARSPMQEGSPADLFVQADITTAGGVDAVVAKIDEQMGGVDLLVNVVGGSNAPGGGFAGLTDHDWQAELERNLYPAVRFDRALLPGMIRQGTASSFMFPRSSGAFRCMRQLWPMLLRKLP
nr:SDR family NAD(P)-dependent oxidoreductase [Microvirga rosea]